MSAPTRGAAGRRMSDVLEDLEVVRQRLGSGATWAELAAELGMTRTALTRAVERARVRGITVPSPRPGVRGRAAELAAQRRGSFRW
jgi:transposase-like protein